MGSLDGLLRQSAGLNEIARTEKIMLAWKNCDSVHAQNLEKMRVLLCNDLHGADDIGKLVNDE